MSMRLFYESLDYAGVTDVGLERDRNEDSLTTMIPPLTAPQYPLGALFAVADGMGGFGGGDIASKLAVDALIHYYYDLPGPPSDPVEHVRNALEAANQHVRKRAQEIDHLRLGTTIVGAALSPAGEVIVFSVGDSRAYRIRQGAIEQLTRDDSVLESLRSTGAILHDEERNDNNLTAYVGQPMTLAPHVRRFRWSGQDTLVLCTDGVWSKVEPHEIISATRSRSAAAGARHIIQRAKQSHKLGKSDNLTVIVIKQRTRALSRWIWFTLLVMLGAMIALWLLGRSGAFEGSNASEPPIEAIVLTVTTEEFPNTPSNTRDGAVLITLTWTPSPYPSAMASATPSLSLTVSPRTTSTVLASRTPTPIRNVMSATPVEGR